MRRGGKIAEDDDDDSPAAVGVVDMTAMLLCNIWSSCIGDGERTNLVTLVSQHTVVPASYYR